MMHGSAKDMKDSLSRAWHSLRRMI